MRVKKPYDVRTVKNKKLLKNNNFADAAIVEHSQQAIYKLMT